MENILHRYNPWWEKGFKDVSFLERKKVFESIVKQLNNRQVLFITGLRRVGKTTLLKMLIQNLIQEHNINPKFIFYISIKK